MNKYINAKRRGNKNKPVFVKERMRGKLRVASVNQVLESFSSICKPKKKNLTKTLLSCDFSKNKF